MRPGAGEKSRPVMRKGKIERSSGPATLRLKKTKRAIREKKTKQRREEGGRLRDGGRYWMVAGRGVRLGSHGRGENWDHAIDVRERKVPPTVTGPEWTNGKTRGA